MSTSNNSKQHTLADSRANERLPMLEKGNYIPWKSRFRRFLDNMLEDGEQTWNSIQNGPYQRPMIPNPDNTQQQILEPLFKMTEASKAKKAAKNHDPLALLAYSNASSSQSHVNSSYSSQPYYVTHPSSVVDYDDEYQGELQGDSQEEKLTTAMMNQVVVQDGRVDILTKNADYGGNANKNAGRQNMIHKPKVRDAKYFREQILLAMKDEAGSNLNNEENDFLLDTSYNEETMEELTDVVMLMARIQPADGNAETVPSYDAKAVSKVYASSTVHGQMSHVKRKTIIHTSDDDQIDSNIIFDDLFVKNNDGTSEHDSNAHDEYKCIQMLAYNVCWDQKSSMSYCCLVSAAEGLQLLKSFYCQMDKDV
nr:hypothetical protein [Tanacetum cinerariifolium]